MASNTGDFFASLSIQKKLLLIMSAVAVPVIVVGAWSHKTGNELVASAQNEVAGVEYIGSLRGLLETLPRHRALVNGYLGGDAGLRSRAEQLHPAIDRALSAVDAVHAKYGETFGTADRLARLKANSQEVKLTITKSQRDAMDTHNRAIADLIDYIKQVGDKSNLVSESELETLYLMDAVVNSLPVITDRINRLGSVAANAAARKAPEDRLQAQVLAEQVDSFVQNMQRGYGVAFANRDLASKLDASLQAAVRGADPLIRGLKEGNVERFASADAASSAFDGFFALYDQTLPALRSQLEARIGRLNQDKWAQTGVTVLFLAAALGLVIVINKSMVGQIKQINQTFARIGQGDYKARLPIHSKDEFGEMAASMNAVLDDTTALVQSRDERNRIQQSIQKLLDDISGVASGDLTQEAQVTAEVTGAIADSFNYMIAELRRLVSNVNATTTKVGQSAGQVLKTAEHLAEGSLGQAQQISHATTSIDHMAKSIREVSSTASTAANVAEQTFQKAKQGSEAVQKTIHGMGGIRNQVQETSKRLKGLGERSQEIGSIVQLIGDIADRTSILALNASIQAAMAGEAGRGFAVVAEEVERLAERAAEATKKVNALIKSIQADTTEAITAMEETTREVVEGSNLANAAGRTLSEIESVSSNLTNLIKSISSASEEQALGSESISKSMNDISTHTRETVEGAKTAATSVQELTKLTDELRRSMQRFRLPADAVSKG